MANTENQVKVKFTERLTSTPAISAKVGSFTTNIVKDVKVDEDDTTGLTYIVTLDSSYLAKASSQTVNFEIAKGALSDSVGNTNAAKINGSLALGLDKVAPTATTSFTDNKGVKTFKLTYNEPVSLEKGLSAITVTTPKGEILQGTDVFSSVEVDSSSTIVILTLKSDVEASNSAYNVKLPKGFVKDNSISANTSAEETKTMTVTASTAKFEVGCSYF